MTPRSVRIESIERAADGLLHFEIGRTGLTGVLDPFAELIWRLSDGSRTVEQLMLVASQAFNRAVAREDVFGALDFLADAGLLQERVAPPAAETRVSRRTLLAGIAPVVGVATAWAFTGAAPVIAQYNESSGKESSNKESNTKQENRESGNKEFNTKESNRESGNKSRDREGDDKRIWSKQQDAEQGRKHDLNKTFQDVNQSELSRQTLEQKMRTSWPHVYDIVGHRLIEFPELAKKWDAARSAAVGTATVTPNNWMHLLRKTEFLFGLQLRSSEAARGRFNKAGFVLTEDPQNSAPLLAGDAAKTTYLTLEHVASPLLGQNLVYSLSADNLRFQFFDQQAAAAFLSTHSPPVAGPDRTRR